MKPFHEQRARRADGTMALHREKPSRRLAPFVITGHHAGIPEENTPPWDDWENDLYYGSLRRYDSGFPLGGGPYAVIGITAKSEDALHDWRDFQQIKNSLLGEEWDAVEIYPAESRLVDPSNRFFLWATPPGGVLAQVGFPLRSVKGPQDGGAPQRAFPEDEP